MAHLDAKDVRLKDGRTVTLRSAHTADAEAVCALTASVTSELAYTLFEPGELGHASVRIGKRVRDAVDDPDELRLIAVVDAAKAPADAQSVVGDMSITAGRWKRLAHVATMGIDIHRDYRRVGLGDAMVREALAWALAHPNIERVELYVYADNLPAVALYRKHGFRVEGKRARYFRTSDGRYFDDLIMARFVKGGDQS